MKIQFVMSVALAAIYLVPGGTATQSPNGIEDCTNNGVHLQVGLDSSYSCEGDCTNNGVAVSLGLRSTHACAGECRNNGIFVHGPGGGCAGGRAPGACLGDECTPNCSHHCESDASNRGVHPELVCRMAHLGSDLECAYHEDCSVMAHADCWAVRLTCTMLFENSRAEETLQEHGIQCQTWSRGQ